jgi:hypothetical protein
MVTAGQMRAGRALLRGFKILRRCVPAQICGPLTEGSTAIQLHRQESAVFGPLILLAATARVAMRIETSGCEAVSLQQIGRELEVELHC